MSANGQTVLIGKTTIPKALFFVPYGNWRVHHQVDVLVAAALRLRGCKSIVVTCDSFYEPCALFRDERHCDVCQNVMSDTLSPFSLPSQRLRSIVHPTQISRADAWASNLKQSDLPLADYYGLPIGEWALSTLMTHFRISLIDQLDRPEVIPTHRRFLRDTLITYWAMDRLVEQEKVSCLFLFNARFYPYRAAFEVAKKRGLRVLVHERGRTNNTYSFFEGETCLGQETISALAEDWSETPLVREELDKLETYFSQRLLGDGGNWPSFYERIDAGDVYDLLDIPRDARLVALFSSSSDEIGHLHKNIINQFDLIKKVSDALAGTGTYLVVRHHPHIGGGPGGSPVEITNFYQAYQHALERPDHVRVIMPKDPISSYALFPLLSGAIAPFSTIGLETTAFGIKTLVCDERSPAFDEDFGFSDWSTDTVKAKIAFLLSSASVVTRDRMRRFLRRMYVELYRSSPGFDIIGVKDHFFAAPHRETSESVTPGRDATLDRICEHLICGAPVYGRPMRSTISEADEDFFIDQKLEAFTRRSREPDRTTGGALPNLGLLVDESSTTIAMREHWTKLPHARSLQLQSFVPVRSGRLLRALRSWRKDADADGDWFRGLKEAVQKLAEEYILVTSSAVQFHDAFFESIISLLQNSRSRPALIAVSGWMQTPNRLAPARFSIAQMSVGTWRDMCSESGYAIRTRHLLPLTVIRRDWLCSRLQEPRDLDEAILTVPEMLQIKNPVFIWRTPNIVNKTNKIDKVS